MKGKMRKHRETGGVNEAEEDVKTKPQNRSNTGEKEEGVANEAEEMKKGGRAKRKHGGKLEHKVEGDKAMKHAGRKPRKNGGRTGSDGSPFTSARHGTNPPGRKEMMGKEGFGED
jgi:hypothetical protein